MYTAMLVGALSAAAVVAGLVATDPAYPVLPTQTPSPSPYPGPGPTPTPGPAPSPLPPLGDAGVG
jgi:hypothetical protein